MALTASAVRPDRLSAHLAAMREAFDGLADSWDSEHGPTSARAGEVAACVSVLRRACRRFRRPRVLDAGCGTGFHLLALADLISEGVGVDLSPAMVERARRKAEGVDARLRFATAAAEEISPEAYGRFHLVFLIGALEHMLDPGRVLTRMGGVLAPAGEVVVIMRNPLHPSALIRRLAGRSAALPPYRHLTPRALATLAEGSGLKLAGLTPVVAAQRAPKSRQAALGIYCPRIYAAHLVRQDTARDA